MILATGQNKCYDSDGREIPCYKSGQDGEFQSGLKLDLYDVCLECAFWWGKMGC